MCVIEPVRVPKEIPCHNMLSKLKNAAKQMQNIGDYRPDSFDLPTSTAEE